MELHGPAGRPAAARTIAIDGVDVLVEGQGEQLLLLLHGWPDTRELWNGTVAHLLAARPWQFTCARFTWPGFDVAGPSKPQSLAQLVALVRAVADALSPGAPVTLVMHDWGCVFGYEFMARHPERVARAVAVDIGDHNAGDLLRSMPARAKLMVAGYQLWLVLAWAVGRRLNAAMGNRMSRWMSKAVRAPAPAARVGWQQNYPYVMQWTGAWGGLRQTARVLPACPFLYAYATRKPFQFQSRAWLDRVAARPGCAVRAFDTGHWVMLQQPDAFHAWVADWLR